MDYSISKPNFTSEVKRQQSGFIIQQNVLVDGRWGFSVRIKITFTGGVHNVPIKVNGKLFPFSHAAWE